MGSLENNIAVLIEELKKNGIDKEHALDYIGHVFRIISTNNIPLDQRNGAAMTVNDFSNKVRSGDFRHAEGFFGNWAKQLDEKKGEVVEEFDDHYSGC